MKILCDAFIKKYFDIVMSLEKYKRVFEGKLLYGWGILCEKVSIIVVHANKNKYNFLCLKGNNGTIQSAPFDMPEEEMSLIFLITQNRFLRRHNYRIDESTDSPRFGTAKIAQYTIDQQSTDPNPSTCMCIGLNHTNNIATLLNISVHSFCKIKNMDEIMNLMDEFLKKVKWTGKVSLSDNAFKNGTRVAIYYMKTHKEANKFSKYQDYGFKIPSKNITKLRKIKKDVLLMSDKAATRKYSKKLGELLDGLIK